VSRLKAWWARFEQTRGMRAWKRYGQARGNVLAGGVAYFAFFSVVPALIVGFSVFALVLQGQSDLQQRIVVQVNTTLGVSLIGLTGSDGVLRPSDAVLTVDQLTRGSVASVTGLVGLAGLLFTGLGWLDAMRQGIRAVFGRPILEGSIVVKKLRDLGVLATLGLVLLASVVASLAITSAGSLVLGWFGVDGSRGGELALSIVGALLFVAVDTGIFFLFFRFLSGVRLPARDLLAGAVVGGVGLGVIKAFSGILVRGASSNPLAATAAVVLTLLVALNLIARLTLIAASWAATTAADHGTLRPRVPDATSDGGGGGPEATSGVDRTRPTAASPVYPAGLVPSVGQRAQDRTAVAAGVILGATGTLALAAVGRAGRAVVDAVRR
jgi:membrane protein